MKGKKELGIDYSNDDPKELFEMLKPLGKGAFGTVYSVKSRETGEIFAMKVCALDNEENIMDLRKEIAVLSAVSNPHIVNFYATYMKDDHLWIQMEFCGGGSLADIVQTLDRGLKEDDIAYTMRQVVLGILYLHSCNRLHRDVKGGNILLTMDGQVKLADFGVAAQLNDSFAKRNTFVGTPHWMAPEVIQENSYDGKADVWSVGILAIELAEINPPYSNQHPVRVIFMIPRSDPPTLKAKDAEGRPTNWSMEFHSFLRACLQKDAEQRETAVELLAHPFVADRTEWKTSPLIPYIEEYHEIVKNRPEDYDDEEELKRFMEDEDSEISTSDDDGISSGSFGSSRTNSPFSSMVVRPSGNQTVLQMLSGQDDVASGGDSSTTEDGSSESDRNDKGERKKKRKARVEKGKETGGKEYHMSDELVNLYRKNCTIQIPFLHLGTLPCEALDGSGNFEADAVLHELVPDSEGLSINAEAMTPPVENLFKAFKYHTDMQNEGDTSTLREAEQRQYAINDISATLRTILQL
mmetsp:Transcript_28139/g.78703  ORF Transcript_28139/g.78703 Transcript_28139/m.78703 type:complete len:523 (-) Transcript_28139:584-2152(-)|eukprot:CAMPEP_0119156238 /NCGR_PEP_ID=MMETSP1310-20130426/52154_1 /TAXON_ID=464262 /ORGANISM="Genus nov. species nov., Strain RCC2339" /LENGTH=522 /DNA_ID=CAMNT_0007148847 /DNA_START=108 /DNA_END=1676 /DNA_ORIENTATION=-